jgi:transketolase
MLQQVYEATEDLDVTVLYYNTVYPFDCKTLLDNLSQNIIICEPFYIGTTNYLITNAIKNTYYKIHNIGVPRKFLKNYGNKQDHDQFLSLDTTGIKNQIESCLIS